MAISFEFDADAELTARIKVVGVGGGGGNALNTMISAGLEGVEFIAANTDAQALPNSLAASKIQLGPQLTKGLGAGGNPDVGRKSALEDVQRVAEQLAGSDMVFVTAGMGGGTGTGAAPVVAQIARDQGALTVGVVTKPFAFEGKRRMRNAEQGIDELSQACDTIITIPNQKLLTLGDQDMSMLEAFQRADDVLLQAVRGISDLIVNPGMINVDFADVKTIMSGMGRALMGTGYGKGNDRAIEAARMAISSPLLDSVSVEGATGILMNFTAGPDMRLSEIDHAASLVQEAAHEDANIIFGVVTDPEMGDMVKVTVIATGFEEITPVDAIAHANHRGAPAHYGHGQMPGRGASMMGRAPARSVQPSYATPQDHGSQMPPRPPQGQMPQPPQARSQHPGHPAQEQVPAPATVPAQARPSGFGASALHDERLLDIPAYLRRSSEG